MAAVKISQKGKAKSSGGTVGSGISSTYTLDNEKPTPKDDIASNMILQFHLDSRLILSVFHTPSVYSLSSEDHTYRHPSYSGRLHFDSRDCHNGTTPTPDWPGLGSCKGYTYYIDLMMGWGNCNFLPPASFSRMREPSINVLGYTYIYIDFRHVAS
ncbi:hypothetical protein BDV36DRAFT_138880 [Aspergillus pseudocaelatus]|uniref:Uncharacterized protein n=1 Tax=Aspergillus pseudocaelatus TaxID=1825620 RepID=A0ABQ6WQ77_9EURO|nr:hypothetical protein BDV36DRAFT_138880 [Aspergillus pseudocaelatus]